MYKGLTYYLQTRLASNMLKNRIIATELLKKRLEDKKKLKKFLILNQADFQLIGGYHQGFSPSLLVNSEGNKYLFNCGDGTQRFCYTNRIKLANLENLFITNLEWNRVSGVNGLSLTLQDIGATSMCVHGPQGIEGLFEASKSFMVFATGMQCSTKNYNDGQYEDSGITIRQIVLHEPKTPPPSKRQKNLSNSNPKLIAYHCSFPDLPGALDPEMCRKLKVPVGRELARLKSGEDVTLSDGRLIRSTEVCKPKNMGLNFIVIECPTLDKIDDILSNQILSELKTGKQIEMVFHFTPEEVANNPRYTDWMNGFDSSCKHVLLSCSDLKRVNFVDSYRFQYLLQKLDDTLFPSLYLPDRLTEDVMDEIERNKQVDLPACDLTLESDPQVVEVNELGDVSNVIKLNSLDKVVIRPNKQLERLDPTIGVDFLYREATLQPDFEQQLRELKQKQQTLPLPNNYEPEVIFLGTGSALPSKYRNTSCIMLNFNHPKKSSVILDCGEDSYGQMFRFYGPNRIKEILKELKLIYISHQHADHHVGLIELLRQRKKVTNQPVAVLIPPGLEHLLEFHNTNFENLSDSYILFSTKDIKSSPSRGQSDSAQIRAIKSNLYTHLDGLLEDLTLVGVEHCINACAVVMSFRIGHPKMSNFSVSYSGDTRPSEEFAIIGRNTDLLIHEATFDYRSKGDALAKKHCTSTEAIQVAKQMGAKFTILTHFSARLAKIPYFTKEFDETIGFAFDNLRLRCPSDFPRLPLLKPILSTIFKKSLDEIDLKYMKTELKQQIASDLIKNQLLDANG